jgi:hypothetical protein
METAGLWFNIASVFERERVDSMSDCKKWFANYSVSVKFPSLSGFEILEMLQARSRLALTENELNAN